MNAPRTLPAALAATVAALALALTGPAAVAKQPKQPAASDYSWIATIDCGAGRVEVGSSDDMWAPLVDLQSGRRYTPVAWRLKAGKKAIRARKPGTRKRKTVKCSYADDVAKGTVTVLKRRR